ncbi:MAG: uracil-DNA glycosylase family protein [Saprospiraceae bacterium]
MNAIQSIREKIMTLKYPSDIQGIGKKISGIGFFPGGNGTINLEEMPNDKPFMILGQDQDNVIGFEKTINAKGGNETYSSTWRNMLVLLKESGIKENDCFFTNFLMGIRKNDSNVGTSPAFMHPDFLAACADIFIDQLKMQRPKGIICLGLRPFQLLGLVSRTILLKNIGMTTFRDIDIRETSLLKGIEFEQFPGFKTNVAVIYHPSYRKLNAKNRNYNNTEGNKAEIVLLNDLKSTIN